MRERWVKTRVGYRSVIMLAQFSCVALNSVGVNTLTVVHVSSRFTHYWCTIVWASGVRAQRTCALVMCACMSTNCYMLAFCGVKTLPATSWGWFLPESGRLGCTEVVAGGIHCNLGIWATGPSSVVLLPLYRVVVDVAHAASGQREQDQKGSTYS